MSRPSIYETASDKITIGLTDYQLATTNIMYALKHNNQWVVELKYRMTTPTIKYVKTFYPSYKQADTARKKIQKRYNVVIDVVELNSELIE